MNLLKNPLFRITGIILILYFGLFANKHERDSLGNRFSKAHVKKHVEEIKEKSFYIIGNVKKAQELQKDQLAAKNSAADFIIKDIKIGNDIEAACNDSVVINYKVFADNKQLESVEKFNFIIGENKINPAIENNLIGLKKDGVRLIIIPSNYHSENKELNEYLIANNNRSINYEINLLEIKKSSAKIPEKCNFGKI